MIELEAVFHRNLFEYRVVSMMGKPSEPPDVP